MEAPGPAGGGDVFVFDGRAVRRSTETAPHHRAASARRPAPGGGDGDTGESEDKQLKRLFKEMQKDVELLGAAGLDKKGKRDFEARRLESLGACAGRQQLPRPFRPPSVCRPC